MAPLIVREGPGGHCLKGHYRDLGRPRTRSATMLRRISDVPASIVLPRLRSCWIVLLLLLVAFVVLATTTWREIGRLFGL